MLLFLAFFAEIDSRPSRVERDAFSPTKGFDLVSNQGIESCSMKPWLKSHQQKKCLAHPYMMESVVRGVSMAVRECENHFSDHRWNCSGLTMKQVFQEDGILKTGN
ncbi:hypothetical protein QZH41_016790 [Actinostola sp. cb2023]|nr:hypothetical protein QZH41_016790 [Actinostola sp. cb2023]